MAVWVLGAIAGVLWGWTGTIVHWNGSVWQSAPGGSGQTLRGVWGNQSSNIWGVGGTNYLMHYDGTSWTSVAVQLNASLVHIHMLPSGHAWIGELVRA